MFKACLECADRIVGREDKKFCSDACRNSYNNKINKDKSNLMRSINNRLRRNYRILSDLNTCGKRKIAKTKLLEKGFDFEYFTHIRKTRSGNVYHFLYDQGYLHLDNDSFIIIKKEAQD